MLKKIFNKKNILYITLPVFVFAFIFLSIVIFNYSGITNLVSNYFYNYINQDINTKTGIVAGTNTQWKSKWDAPYPRVGQLYFYSGGKADTDLWKNFGMVAMRSYAGVSASSGSKLKRANPNIILLAASGDLEGAGIKEQFKKDPPDEWSTYKSGGTTLNFGSSPMMNVSSVCPEATYEGTTGKFNDFWAKIMYEKYGKGDGPYDGIFIDSWFTSHWQIGTDLDLNRDGAKDSNPVKWWQEGNREFVAKFRQLAGPGVPVIGHEEPGNKDMNGNGFEFWSQVANPVGGHSANLANAIRLSRDAIEPIILYCNSEAGGDTGQKYPQYGYDKLSGPAWRADFTSSQMAGCFSGHDYGGGYAHLYPIMHDEYEGDLGYPLGSAKKISGVWVRYFDKGVVISNISGGGKSIGAGDLDGRTYYRFLGNQEPAFNNGKQFTSVNLAPMDGIMMLTEQLV